MLRFALVPPPAGPTRRSAALVVDLARRPPRIGFGLSFVGAPADLRADLPRRAESSPRVGVLGFFVLAILLAFFGFGALAGTAAWIARAFFVGFLVLAIGSLFFGRLPKNG